MLYDAVSRIRNAVDGWKTIIFHSLTTLPSALYAIYLEFASVDITPLIPVKYAATTIAVLGVIGVVIRLYTDNAVGVKGPAQPADQKEGL